MNTKQIAIYTAIVIALSVTGTKYLWPTVQSSLKIEEKEVIKKDIITIIKEKKNPDGSTETETTITDKSKEARDKLLEQIVVKPKDWFVSGGATVNPNDLTLVYNAQVNRRIIGPVYIGATVNTRKDVGLSVGFEF